jgi:hypothetical protein
MAKKQDDSAGKKNAGGRTIAAWKTAAGWPNTTDEQLIHRINRMAQEGGYDYTLTPEQVKKWRAEEAKGTKTARSLPAATVASRSQGKEEGEALATLRTLVKLLGRDAVKTLIDGL